MSQKQLNQILLNLRENHNLKQKDVAKILGISQQTYSNYELGKRELPSHHLKPLAELYHISLDMLLDISIEPHSLLISHEQEFTEGVTMSKLIYDLNHLSVYQRKELLKYMEYLKQVHP